jgi:hypothetical protein
MVRAISTLAVAPLVSDVGSVEHGWLGASLGKLLAEHLAGAGLPVMHYNAVGEATLKLDQALPLDEDGVEAVMGHLGLSTLVAGGFHLEGDRLHLSLTISSADETSAPLTDSASTRGFSPLVERVTLALVKRLGFPLNEETRRRVKLAPRPRKFEAFHSRWRERAPPGPATTIPWP